MKDSSKPIADYHPWTTYIAAREEARRWGDRRIGTDHLVLGLLRDPEIGRALGVTLESARETMSSLDRRALAIVGLASSVGAPPLPERPLPPKPTLKAVLMDRLPLTPAAKAALQKAARPMRRGQHVKPQQVLLVLIDNRAPDPAANLLTELGVDAAAVREYLATSFAA